MENKAEAKGQQYFLLALLVFAGLSIEAIYAFLIEPMIYGAQMQEWTTVQTIIHWIVTCITWSAVLFFIFNYAKNKLDFQMKESGGKISTLQWGAVLIFVILGALLSYWSWDGFKVVKAFMKLGWLKFIFQYIYYAIETCMITGIIVFGQKACEKWFKNKNIPYGGIICALTWGVAHFASKGDFVTGVLTMIFGFAFGSIYLLLNRDIAKTVPILFLMFAI